MIHRKARSLMGSGEVIARLAAQAVSDASSQMTRPTGSIATHASDGTVTVTGPILVPQGGSAPTQATHVGDTTAPGKPTGILISSASSLLTVHWNGSLDGGVPGDFSHITIYVDPAVNGSNILGQMSTAGDLVSSGVTVGSTYTISATSEDDVCNMDGTSAHNVSDKVTVGSVLIEALSAEDQEARASAEAAKQLAQESKDIANAANTASTEANDKVAATRQYFFDDGNGVHVTNTKDDPNGCNNIILNALGILLRAYENNLISITPSGITIFDGKGNANSNITSMFKSNRIELGHNNTTDNHLSITPAAVNILNGQSILSSFRPGSIRLGSQTDKNVSISNNDMTINDGSRKIATFAKSNISLGDDDTSSTISLCGETTKIEARKFINQNGFVSHGSHIENNGYGFTIERSHQFAPEEVYDKKYIGYTKGDGFYLYDDESGIATTINIQSDISSGKMEDHTHSSISIQIERTPTINYFKIYNQIIDKAGNVKSTFVAMDAFDLIRCLNSVQSSMNDWVYLYGSGENGNVLNTIKYKAINGICYMTFDLTGIPTNGWYCPTKLPTQYLPDTASYIGATDYPSGAAGLVWLVSKSANGSGPWFMNTGSGRLVGTISWPY